MDDDLGASSTSAVSRPTSKRLEVVDGLLPVLVPEENASPPEIALVQAVPEEEERNLVKAEVGHVRPA
jgi:hypothetical protein